jgi:uncharacterized protein YjbI with pentapeptide repeats
MEMMMMQTKPYAYTPQLKPQRNGAIEPTEVVKLLAETTQQVNDPEAINQLWKFVGSNETRNILISSGLLIAFRKKIQEAFQSVKDGIIAKQINIQNNPTIKDLGYLKEVSNYCRVLLPGAHIDETPEMMELAEKYYVGIESQFASNQNRRGVSIAKTANTNISGLWVKNADLPAQYGNYDVFLNPLRTAKNAWATYRLRKRIQAIETSRRDVQTGEKTFETVVKHKALRKQDNVEYLSQRISRSQEQTPQAYRDAERQNIRVRRHQGEGTIAKGTRISDTDWRDAVLYKANLEDAYLDLMDLSLADMRLINAKGATFKRTSLDDADLKGLDAPKSEWGGVNADYADVSFAYSTGIDSAYRLYKTPNLREAIFHHVITDPITFKLVPAQNTFDGADFRGVQLQGAQLIDFHAKWADFNVPEWLPATEEAKHVPLPAILREKPNSQWEAYDKPPVDFTGASMWNVNLEGSTFKGAQFKNVTTHNNYLTVHRVAPLGKELTGNEVPVLYNAWLRPYRTKAEAVNLKDANLENTTWDDTLLNRVAFDTTKVLEEDESKVNSTTLEPSFNFEGAVLDGANFSKAKFIVPNSNERVTVEEALAFKNRNFEAEKEQALNDAKQQVFMVDKCLLKDRAEQDFVKNKAKVVTLNRWLERIFGKAKSVNEETIFSQNEALNKDFIDTIQIRMPKNDQDKSNSNPFTKILNRFRKEH